jgi:hypothetical protein
LIVPFPFKRKSALSAQKEQDAIACLNRHLNDNPVGKNPMQ